MYQSVDDIDEAESGDAPAKKLTRLKVTAIILLGIALLALVAVFSLQSRKPVLETSDQTEEQYAVYLTAATEREPALRRARLLDFIQTYPDHDRIDAAQAQLSVINGAEAKDWAALTDVFYDPVQSYPAKLAGLQLYQEIWGTELLGGREEDMARLKSAIEQDGETPTLDISATTEESPDFTPPPDSFADNINGSEMAGGVVIAERAYIPPTPVETLRPGARGIVEPKIRKNVRPRYPSRALRKGYGAEIVLAMDIDDEGKVQMTELVSARARKYRKDFIRAAERAALKTRFHPKTVNGRPVAARGVTKRFVFRVEE